MRKAVVTSLLFAFLFCQFVVYSPTSPIRDRFAETVRPVLSYFGLFYTFWPFAHPAKVNESYHAKIAFADGNTKNWPVPQSGQYRKYQNCGPPNLIQASWCLHMWDCFDWWLPKEQVVLPGLARFAAKQFADHKPVSVLIYKHTQAIAAPVAASTENSVKQEVMFEYQIQEADLR